ncbi:MAG: Abi family protein [Gammaproteobacteria bacterium]|nr:Abi family protein [Gammaproteobacteria bacterium]
MSFLSFTKQPLTCHEQVDLLQRRGPIINNPEQAAFYLSTISYYRLSAYFKPFEQNKDSHLFSGRTTFQDIVNLYQFERALRLKVMDAIERIEVVLRAGLAQELSVRHGAWWYLDNSLFKSEWQKPLPNKKPSPQSIFESELQLLIKQKKEEFIKHYYQKYHSPPYPPSWMILECLSFDQCINLFRYLLNSTDKSAISKLFCLDPIILDSAFDCIRLVRNICAHHAKLWDRCYTYVPKKMRELQQAECPRGSTKEQLALLDLMLKPLPEQNNWQQELYQLFEKYSAVPFQHMGFQVDWQNDKFWQP